MSKFFIPNARKKIYVDRTYKGYRYVIHPAGVDLATDVEQPLAYDVYPKDELDKRLNLEEFGDGYIGCEGAIFSGDNQHIPELNVGKRNIEEMEETIKEEIDRLIRLKRKLRKKK